MTTRAAGIPKDKILPILLAENAEPGINLALAIASTALLHKKTWDNHDYATHWLHVAGVDLEHLSDEEKIIGILHDVVEDSDWEVEDLEALGFSPRICQGVDNVTKQKGEKYFDAIERCSGDPMSRKIKMRDNKHNMDLTRSIHGATIKQQFWYQISYHYLKAVDKGQITAGTPIWKFLAMPQFSKLLAKDGDIESPAFVSIARNATSHPAPAALIERFGNPYQTVAERMPSLTPQS